MVTQTDPRAVLRAAQSALARAERDLGCARAATGRGRALLESVILDVEKLDADDRRRADELADKLRGSIAKGVEAKLEDEKPIARNMVSRAELETRRVAIERAVADFAAAEHEASLAVERAREAVGEAIQGVLKAEAEKIANRWAQIEREARALRVRLGCQGDPVWSLCGLVDAGRKATYQNHEDDGFDLQQRQIAGAPWIDLAAALAGGDADARPDFTEADRAIAALTGELAERRAADERYIARLRVEAA